VNKTKKSFFITSHTEGSTLPLLPKMERSLAKAQSLIGQTPLLMYPIKQKRHE